MLNEKALEVAIDACVTDLPDGGAEIDIQRAIAAYISALLPEDAAGLVDRLLSMPTCSCAGDGTEDPNPYKQAASLIQSQGARIAELEAKVAAQVHRATNAEYFNVAYRNMLGPVGRQVAEMWREKGVRRVHFDWGPEADNLTGEERAQIILDVENAPSRVVEDIDGHGNGPRTKGSRSFVEFVADLTKDRQP